MSEYPYTLDIAPGETITYAAPTIVNKSTVLGLGFEVSAPNVWTDGNETVESVTRMQFAWIGAAPFISFGRDGGGWSDLTRVVNPERFGPLPASDDFTRANVRTALAWVHTFVRGEEVGE